jgi:hypothetical protein
MPPRRGQSSSLSSSLSPLPEWCNKLLEFENKLQTYCTQESPSSNGPPDLSRTFRQEGTSIINELSETELLDLYKMYKNDIFQQYFNHIWNYFNDELGFNKRNFVNTEASECTCGKKFELFEFGRYHCRSCGQAKCFWCLEQISPASKLVRYRHPGGNNDNKNKVYVCKTCMESKGGSKKKKKKSTKKIVKVVAGKKRVIHTGPKGGKYYISKGSKRYIK